MECNLDEGSVNDSSILALRNIHLFLFWHNLCIYEQFSRSKSSENSFSSFRFTVIVFKWCYAMNAILTYQKPAKVLITFSKTWDEGFWKGGNWRKLCSVNITKDLWRQYVNWHVYAKECSSVISFQASLCGHDTSPKITHVQGCPQKVKNVRLKKWTRCLRANTGRLLCVSTDCSDEKCWPIWETLYQSNIKLNIQWNLKGHALLPCL